jgi:hypothetical protein
MDAVHAHRAVGMMVTRRARLEDPAVIPALASSVLHKERGKCSGGQHGEALWPATVTYQVRRGWCFRIANRRVKTRGCRSASLICVAKTASDSTAPKSQSGRGVWRHRHWPAGPTHQRFLLFQKFTKIDFRARKISRQWGKIQEIL